MYGSSICLLCSACSVYVHIFSCKERVHCSLGGEGEGGGGGLVCNIDAMLFLVLSRGSGDIRPIPWASLLAGENFPSPITFQKTPTIIVVQNWKPLATSAQ